MYHPLSDLDVFRSAYRNSGWKSETGNIIHTIQISASKQNIMKTKQNYFLIFLPMIFSVFTMAQCPTEIVRFTSQAQINRSEEHTSELQSRENLVCRLLLEKKKKKNK